MDPEQGNKKHSKNRPLLSKKRIYRSQSFPMPMNTSEIGFESQTQQIAKTQNLIDLAYQQAGKTASPLFSFSSSGSWLRHAWVIDFETIPEQYRDYVQHLFWGWSAFGDQKSHQPKEQKDLKIQINIG